MTGRRKRLHVPEDSRKRVARACDACRRLKEKCDGRMPCTKCTKSHRNCQYVIVPKVPGAEPRHDQMHRGTLRTPSLSQTLRVTQQEADEEAKRVQALEDIVKHFTDIAHLDKVSVVEFAESLCHGGRVTSSATTSNEPEIRATEGDSHVDAVSVAAAYTGAFSHRDFSDHVQRRINEDLQTFDTEHVRLAIPKDDNLSRASRLHLRLSVVIDASAALPPREVSEFLIDTFFNIAQTNYSYVDERSLRERLDGFYHDPHALATEDAAWLCMVLMVFAVGTQFAHLSSDVQTSMPTCDSANDTLSVDDSAGLSFYHAAVTLIPDTMSLASIESVQAFLLLGVYTLPIDAAGLSFTYLGVSIKMAIQNGMHRSSRKNIDAHITEMRNRVWWTAYTLEKRVCVLHGLPTSISKGDVDANEPSELASLQASGRIDTLPNIRAMIRLTSILEDARDSISHSGKLPTSSCAPKLSSISLIRKQLQEYWESLPVAIYCRDLTPHRPLFRFNVHLALTYHLVHIFIGRNFIFSSPYLSASRPSSLANGSTWEGFCNSVVSSCVESAIEIINLCQTLQEQVGLARASYTEFTSCRAALLAIMAHRMRERSVRLSAASEQGMQLLKHMSLGFYSADAEKAQVEAMETAIRRLDRCSKKDYDKTTLPDSSSSAYDRFRKWARLWKADGGGRTVSPSLQPSSQSVGSPMPFEAPNSTAFAPLSDLGWDLDSSAVPYGTGDEFIFFDDPAR